MAEKAKWFVVHTYSGYENKVKADLEKKIEKDKELKELIHEIQVPMSEEIEEKDGKQKVSLKKTFPGYVFVKMIMTDRSWYVVRNTRGATGFVGSSNLNPGTKPIPLTEDELHAMGIREERIEVQYELGEKVIINSGSLKGREGAIQEINTEKRKVKVLVELFGRDVPTELEFNNIEKIN